MQRRGVTLIELLVAMAILGVVVVVGMNALLGFKRVVEIANHRRLTHTQVRQAALFLDRDLRLAGYAMEPALALDFSVYAGSGTYCGSAPGVSAATNTCPSRRDRTDGPDELVFYARNPEYWGGDLASEPEGHAWTFTSATASSLTLSAHGGEYFARGQILQLVCSGGTTSAYVRVATSRSVGTAGATTLSLEAAVAGDPYTQSPEPFVASCAGAARVFQVERFRYFVDPAVVLGDGSTAPFLMLDRGVDRNQDDVVNGFDLIPVAQGIVDLQVSYLRPEPTLTEVGATRGVSIGWCDAAARPISGPGACAGGLRLVQFSAGAGASDYANYTYFVPSAGALRSGPDAANVASIRIALVGRSLSSTPATESHPLLLNRSELAPEELDQNAVFGTTELTVPTPNLQSRGLTFL